MGQELLLWPWAPNLYDYHLDLVFKNSFYHLYGDVSMNLFEQAVIVNGSERSRFEINLKYMWHLRLDHVGKEMINRLEKCELLGLLTVESYLVCVSSL